MNADVPNHPDSERLREFARGALGDDDLERIAEHLQCCAACLEAVDRLFVADGLLDRLKSAGTLSGDPPDTEAERLEAALALRRRAERSSRGPGDGAVEGESVPREVGQYEVVREVGRGGMGVVYLARHRGLRRPVALKMILAGGFASEVQRQRFRREAELAARVQHPHIVQVFEVGVHDGRPFLAMEWMAGGTLSDRIGTDPWPPNDAARLIETLARAIDAAHRKGVVHRDLKPSNILLQPDRDGEPSGPLAGAVPKVADFGLARAIEGDSHLTSTGVAVGTPEYMAPEQATGGAAAGPGADIYALGAILYQLLVGRPPFRGETPLEVLQALASNEPIAPHRLRPRLPRDLETIALKALDRDPARRYATADLLADDLRRFLAGEPILARPASALYQLRKFARRHRALVAGVSGIFAALLAATIVSTWQAVRATRAEAAALAREAETQAVLDFVEQRVFAAARPEGQESGLGREVTLRRAIEAALPLVDKSFRHQPLIEARLRLTLGMSFHYLSEGRTAAEQCEAARALYAQHVGPDHPDTLRSMHFLAISYHGLGRYADALKLNEESLPLMKAKLGPDHRDTLRSMHNLASCYADLGRPAEAVKLFEETLVLRKARLGPDHPDTFWSMSGLALSYTMLGRDAEALKLREETLAHQKAKLGPDHPATLWSMHHLASSYADFGRLPEALKLEEETLALRKAKLGPDHRDTLWSMNSLAWFRVTASDAKFRDPPRAVELAAKAAELLPLHATPRGTLGTARYRTGDWKGAIADLDKAIGLRNPDHPSNAYNGFVLAMAHWQLGEKDKARAWFDKSMVWMAKGLQENAELKHFRAEAAQLLGIETTK